MMETNSQPAQPSPVERGRDFLERGDVASAVECYSQVYDPDALDESEAREMLIEARAHLSRKRILDALECFEEALLMGTDIQRRQALDGLSTAGEILPNLQSCTSKLKKGLKEVLGRSKPESIGLAVLPEEENIVAISDEATAKLPPGLRGGNRICRLSDRLKGYSVPFGADRCIPYADEKDVEYIIEVAKALLKPSG
jgi:tetratricopeptide (TPR) repeat protein